jgi:NAD(P)-dependent dehydrogenase (short-subunit alcohol dehydrogenase family)
MRFDQRVACVTGAARGIGRAVAERLSAEGAAVAVIDVDGDAAAKTAAGIEEQSGRGALALAADISTKPAADGVIAAVLDRWGRLDVLVNNAGIAGGWPENPSTIDLDTVRRLLETNVIGVIRVTNALLPLLRRSAHPRIVNQSSHVASLALQTTPDLDLGGISAAYAPTKTYLNALTIQYAKELADTSVLINNACPGYVATDLNAFTGTQTPAQGAAIAIRLATLPDNGPTGHLFDDNGVVPW